MDLIFCIEKIVMAEFILRQPGAGDGGRKLVSVVAPGC